VDAGTTRRKADEASELSQASGVEGFLGATGWDRALFDRISKKIGPEEPRSAGFALIFGYYLCEVLRAERSDMALAEAVEVLRTIASGTAEDPIKLAEQTLEDLRHGREGERT
jgi:hypothetical protein